MGGFGAGRFIDCCILRDNALLAGRGGGLLSVGDDLSLPFVVGTCAGDSVGVYVLHTLLRRGIGITGSSFSGELSLLSTFVFVHGSLSCVGCV